MPLKFTSTFQKMLAIFRRNDDVQPVTRNNHRRQAEVEMESHTCEPPTARDYYNSVLSNAILPAANPREETFLTATPQSQAQQTASGRGHWFDFQQQQTYDKYDRLKQADQSWQRLEAFKASRKEEELKSLDSNWGSNSKSKRQH